MAYTTIDDPTIYFNTKLYTGNGSTQSITGVGFQPDWLWIKQRSNAENHFLFDAVRGVNKRLISNLDGTESTEANSMTSFDSDGFSLGNGRDEVNQSGASIVAWNWKAGGSASSNSNGDITSSVSANTTAGFSIVSYTGNGSAGATVGHGLNSKPSWMVVKRRNSSEDWRNYHSTLGATKFLNFTTNAAGTSSNRWNDTEPTTSVFTIGDHASVNGSGDTFIAYLFAEKKGYSKFGSYTGNDNANGTFVYTGFAPAWVMIKRTNSVNDWIILDTKRNPINPSNERLLANTNGAASTANTMVDFLSNGFKPRSTYGGINGASDNFIYIAFAESPFTNSNGVPNNAR